MVDTVEGATLKIFATVVEGTTVTNGATLVEGATVTNGATVLMKVHHDVLTAGTQLFQN